MCFLLTQRQWEGANEYCLQQVQVGSVPCSGKNLKSRGWIFRNAHRTLLQMFRYSQVICTHPGVQLWRHVLLDFFRENLDCFANVPLFAAAFIRINHTTSWSHWQNILSPPVKNMPGCKNNHRSQRHICLYDDRVLKLLPKLITNSAKSRQP